MYIYNIYISYHIYRLYRLYLISTISYLYLISQYISYYLIAPIYLMCNSSHVDPTSHPNHDWGS